MRLTRRRRRHCCCLPSRVSVADAARCLRQYQRQRVQLRLYQRQHLPHWLANEKGPAAAAPSPSAAPAAFVPGGRAAAGGQALAPAAGRPAPPAPARQSPRPAQGGGRSTTPRLPQLQRASGPGSTGRMRRRTSACSARSRGPHIGACRRCRLGAAARRAAGRQCLRLPQVDLRVDRRSQAVAAEVAEAAVRVRVRVIARSRKKPPLDCQRRQRQQQ